MKYRLIYTLALLMALPLVAQAQKLHQWRVPGQTDTREAAPDGLRKLHITDKIANSPEGRQALADFHRRKALGLLPRAAKSADALGDTLTFKVRNNSTNQVDNIDFKLMAIDVADPPRFQIWVELAELNNELLDVEAIVRALGESTPQGSFDPNEGILVLDEQVFGDPPDVDGDGITDVLVLDIRDDYDEEEGNLSWLAGFVDGRDLSGLGNNRDVLYLDTEPTLRRRSITEMEQTAAHEYQHLIHFHYDRNELSFVNEGLSEWAEVLTGYLGRPINYLDDVDNYNVPFLRFSSEVFESIDDRERGAMFINYIADRFGEVNIGFITRQERNGTDGIRDGLDSMQVGVSFEELLFDFHIANFLNDTSLDERYGYTTEQRMGIQAAPAAFFDGRTGSETPSTSTTVRPGAVQYLVWTQVKDFSITLSGLASLRAVALLFQGASFEVRALNLDNTANTIDGEYDRIAVVVAHIDPDVSTVSLAYSATWTVDQMVSITTIQYDNGQVATFPDGTGIFFTLGQMLNPNVALVTRFVVPFPEQGTTLDKVLIAPFFSNQFNNPMGTPSDPRDFTFYVFGPEDDGEPGDIIFSQVFDDPREFRSITSRTLDFIELDLSSFVAELTSLPDTIYVGYGEAGETTETVLVVAPSPYSVGNVSFIGNFTTGNWDPLWDVQFVGGDPEDFPVKNTVIPIRAQFAVVTRTDTEDDAEVPEAIVLYPNFPNPFNPTTAIRYALPQATEVRLAVFDLLGREVAVLVEGMKPPGEHQVQVDAGQWASGLYFYTIEADGQKRTQRMVLIK